MSRWKQISSLVNNKTFASSLQRTSYTFTPNKEEVIESRFRLRYSTTCNSYYRDWLDAIDPSSQGVITGWEKALYSQDSVRRHINEDIGQVYLEREPGSSTGCIKWRMDFGCCGLLVDEVTIRLSCVEDYGGEMIVTLIGHPGQKRVRYAVGSDYVTYTDLQNSPELTLAVHFVGEDDQVTQLFPQNILRGMGYPLDIQVILKPPFQSLGIPRILVGLLYSSSQEIEVDARHYKQNTSNQSSQGFLHIHLLRGKDLPQGKHGTPETFSKCYLLPDAKKTTKCRTKTRKGKDPYWNEQFLVVGINYHEIKRRALEICIADNHTSVGKKAKFIGGVRLSLGYKTVLSAQTKQVNQVLRFLKGKGGVSGEMIRGEDVTGEGRDDKDAVIGGSVNSSALKWKQANCTRVTTEKSTDVNLNEKEETTNTKENKTAAEEGKEVSEKLAINDENDANKFSTDATKTNIAEIEPQSVSSSSPSTEEITAAWDSVPDPTVNLEKDLGTSLETCDDGSKIQNTTEISEVSCSYASTENDEQPLVHQRLFQSVMTSIKELEFASCHGSMELALGVPALGDPALGDPALGDPALRDPALGDPALGDPALGDPALGDPALGDPDNDTEQDTSGLKNKTLHNGDLTDNGITLNAITTDDVVTKAESGHANSPNSSEHSRLEDDHRNGGDICIKPEAANQEKSTNEDFLMKIAAKKLESLEGKPNSRRPEITRNAGLEIESITVHEEARKASAGSNEIKRSSSFTLRDLGKKLNLRRRSKSSEDEDKGSYINLDANANKVMLDAQGLEMTQWKLMVERPKEWHYCWQILRSEMTILH